MTTPTMTFCGDARCVSSQRCQRAEHERYGTGPGESYGPRCVPVPYGPAYEQGIAEGERRATERIVVWLRRESYPCCNQCNNQLADYIERGEHRREGED